MMFLTSRIAGGAPALMLLASVAGAAAAGDGRGSGVRLTEIALDGRQREEATLARPVSIGHGPEAVYVVDADDHAVRVFSKDGIAAGSLGRKGKAPGEFDTPADLDIRDGRLYVADRFNQRIQILDGGGKYLGGFAVPFSPDQICVPADGKIVVSHLPVGLGGPEPMIHCYSAEGRLLWEGERSHYSGDRVYDMFRNLLVLLRGEGGEVWVVRKSDRRTITRFDGEGKELTPIGVGKEYESREIKLPIGPSGRILKAFCWDAARGGRGLGLLAPDPDGRGDLGPGSRIFLIAGDGGIAAVVGLPEPMNRIDLDGERIYAFDLEGRLRIFRMGT